MPMPPDVESYLRSLAHRFNEPDLREVANEIERLTAEVAKWQEQAEVNKHDAHSLHDIVVQKDKRIEELLEAEIEPIVGVFRNGHLVTYKQIDKAWDRRGMCDTLADEEHLDGTLAELGIVACEECGGSGEYIAATDPDGRQWPDCCPTCHGHRWVKVQTKPRVPFVCEGEWIITSQLVDKCGQFGTGDDDE